MTLLVAVLIAQTPMGVATKTEAQGFRISERGRFHVGGNVDLRFDSNPAFYPRSGPGDLALRIRAIAAVAQPGEKLEVAANLSADWTQYLGVIYVGTRTLSAFQAALDGGLIANKNGWMTFFLSEQLSRVEQPANDAVSQRLKSIRSYTRTGTDIRPGGRALEIRVQYGFDFVYYDQNQLSVVDPAALTFMTHAPALRGMWRFFPKTALTLDAEAAITRYPLASTLRNQEVNAFRVQAGVLGQITPKLTLTARAGYANTFIQVAAVRNFSSVIGTAQLTWKPFETTSIGLGYTRDFAPTSIYGWVSFDRAYLEGRQLFLQRFAIDLRVIFEHQTFGTPIVTDVQPGRQDEVIRGEARFIAQILPYLAASAYYMPDFRITPFVSPIGVAGSYQRHVTGVDVTAMY